MQITMKSIALTALLAFLPVIVFAQPAPGAGPGSAGGPRPQDCTKVADKERCELRNAAIEACKDKPGPERQECLREKFPRAPQQARDCSKATNREACERANAAVAACTGKTGNEYDTCMQAQLGRGGSLTPQDCTKASDAARCEQRNAAIEACKDKTGGELRACVREKMPRGAGPGAPAPKA